MISRIDHVSLEVKDREKMLRFYIELGFERVKSADIPEKSMILDMLSLGDGSSLELRSSLVQPNQGTSSQALSTARETGFGHIALRVEHIDDEVARLKMKGVTLASEILDGRFGRFVFFLDPEGNMVELIE